MNGNASFTADVLGRAIKFDVSNDLKPASLSPAALEAGAARMHASRFKRAMDVLVAGCGLLFLAPVLLLVALVIRLETPGPVLFRQRRTGCGGTVFYMYKFRSMRAMDDGAAIKQATPGDPRITRVGAFLRRTSIDEIPQLLNVLKNDMSLIGPRPHAVAHDLLYGAMIDDYRLRFLAKPGISGLAQVSGHRGATPDSEAMARRVAVDLDYIADWSFALDVRILIRTVLTGPFHPAAY